MAPHTISIVNSSARPTDGNSWFAPYTTLNSGSTQDPMVYIKDQGVVSTLKGSIKIPENYASTPELVIVWTSETTAGDVDFAFRHRTIDGSDIELLDISTSPTERSDTSLNNTGPSAASERMVTTITLTATDLTAGATLYYEFDRDGVTDTKAAEISMWEGGPHFKYADV